MDNGKEKSSNQDVEESSNQKVEESSNPKVEETEEKKGESSTQKEEESPKQVKEKSPKQANKKSSKQRKEKSQKQAKDKSPKELKEKSPPPEQKQTEKEEDGKRKKGKKDKKEKEIEKKDRIEDIVLKALIEKPPLTLEKAGENFKNMKKKQQQLAASLDFTFASTEKDEGFNDLTLKMQADKYKSSYPLNWVEKLTSPPENLSNADQYVKRLSLEALMK